VPQRGVTTDTIFFNRVANFQRRIPKTHLPDHQSGVFLPLIGIHAEYRYWLPLVMVG
jgi:hypothetical protein